MTITSPAICSRRQFLKVSAGLSLAGMGLWLAGCGGPASPRSSVPSDVVRVTYDRLQPSLDPHDWDTSAGPITLSPMFDALTFIDSTGALRPALALAWELKDPTTWQFRIREADAKFQNGEPFYAESVRVSFERAIDPKSNLALTPLLSTIDRIEVLNRAAVNIITKEPDPILPRRASLVYMLPPKYFGQAGAQRFAQQPIGTGQWSLEDFQANQSISFKLYNDTWRAARGDPLPDLTSLQIQAMPNASDRVAALRAGQLDIAVAVAGSEAKSLRDAGFTLTASQVGRIDTLLFDTTRAPFSDERVRQAVNLSIDRQALVKEALAGYAQPAQGQLTTSAISGFASSVKAYPFDPSRAQQLLQETGLPGSLETEIEVLPDFEPAAKLIADSLERVGMHVTVRKIQPSDYLAKLRQGNRAPLFAAAAEYGLFMDADAAYFRYSSAMPEASRWGTDSEVSDLLLRSRGEPDPKRRADLLSQLAAKWHERALGVPLFGPTIITAAHSRIKHLSSLPSGSWWFDRIAK